MSVTWRGHQWRHSVTLSVTLGPLCHWVSDTNITLTPGAEKQRARNQSTIATKSQKINKASSARDCFRFGCFFQSLENVSPVDPGVPHYPCCLVANAVLCLTNCLPGRAGGLGTNKTCVNSPFQFVSPGLAEPPETTNIVRLGPGSYRSQSHSHSSVVL